MASTSKKLCSSIVYGFMGLILYFFNKIILTTYKFPYFCVMGLLQSITITIIFRTLKHFRFVRFPDFSIAMMRQLFPIPLFYFVNLVTGLGATKFITAPMFVVLRRFSIPFTLFLQYHILGINCSKKAILAICILLFGSLVAMLEDFSFNLIGYLLCFINDMGDSFESIYTKKQLIFGRKHQKSPHESQENLLDAANRSDGTDCESQSDSVDSDSIKSIDDSDGQEFDIGKAGILYYSAFFNIFPLFLLVLFNGDLIAASSFEHWNDPLFTIIFITSSLLSVLFLYTWITCTDLNSPLLSQIISCLRSILTTYIGMYVGGDYIFNIFNFTGLNISMIGAFYYAYVNFTDDGNNNRKSITDNEKSNSNKKKLEL